jgi:hypothetical protein
MKLVRLFSSCYTDWQTKHKNRRLFSRIFIANALQNFCNQSLRNIQGTGVAVIFGPAMQTLPNVHVMSLTNMTTFCKFVIDLVVKRNCLFICLSYMENWYDYHIQDICTFLCVCVCVCVGGGGGGGVQNIMNERMHQCTTLNTTDICKN